MVTHREDEKSRRHKQLMLGPEGFRPRTMKVHESSQGLNVNNKKKCDRRGERPHVTSHKRHTERPSTVPDQGHAI